MVGDSRRIFFKSQFTCQYKNGSIVALYYCVKMYIFQKFTNVLLKRNWVLSKSQNIIHWKLVSSKSTLGSPKIVGKKHCFVIYEYFKSVFSHMELFSWISIIFD